MRNIILRTGSSGPFVRELQLALNSRLNPSPNLIINGLYTPQTDRAVRAFQLSNWLVSDGIADLCTLQALHGTEVEAAVLHSVPYYAQADTATSWAAATAMLTQSSAQAVRLTTPQELLDEMGTLITDGGAGQRQKTNQDFARVHRLRYFEPQSWPVATLVGFLRRGPLMLELLNYPGSVRRGPGPPPKRYIVVVGARGSHTPDGMSTTLRIHDPNPRINDGIYSTVYENMLRSIPLAIFGIFIQ